MRIGIGGFLGENRAIHPKLLPEGVGVTSTNQHPGRGDLRPWNLPGATLATVAAGTQTIYRFGRDVASDTTYWFRWNTLVHAMRGFIADDTTERTYYTGDGAPKVTDNTMLGAGPVYPGSYRLLGIPAPAAAPTVAALSVGTSASTEDRFYVYTYVSDKGEEGPPSPVSTAQSCKVDATFTLSGFSAVPAGYSFINRMRIYRTESGSTGATNFFFVKEVSAWGSTTDTVAGKDLGEGITSTFYFPPNADSKWLTPMWAGMAAVITGKAVRYCEPNLPYAWPPQYETLPPDATPVALVRYMQNLLVLTTGKPLLVTGSSPESMDEQPIEIIAPCVAARSAVSVGHGAVWASNDGLMYFGANGAKMLTTGLLTREDWLALVPSTMIGVYFKGLYFCRYVAGGQTRMFVIDPQNPTGLYFIAAGYDAYYYDDLQDSLFILNSTIIAKWDAGTSMGAVFKSKTYKAPHPTNMACAEVVSDSFPVTFKLYADGVLKHTQTVTSRDPFWLPSGYLAEDWAVQLECDTNIQGCAVAESMEELRQV